MRRRTPDFLVDALSRPENHEYVATIEAALMWGRTPMDILIPPHTRDRYEDLDLDAIESANLALMVAWSMLKSESCPKCGMPFWIGHNTDNYIQFSIEESTCYSCASVERHDEKNKKAEPGVVAYPVLKMELDAPRPTRDAGYLAMRGQDV